jgi:LCP family protein required for cell wall assembly
LATIEPPLDDGHLEDAVTYEYHRRGVNTRLIIGIGVFAVMSLYLSLVAVSRVDGVLFPGNELGLPGVTNIVGISAGDTPASAETIDQRINILFLGLDQRLDEPDNDRYRTDSIVIFTIDPYSKTAGSFSIPRDTRVSIPDPNGDGGVYTKTRINEAYEMGQYGVNYQLGYDGGGPQLVKDTIEMNFGIPINYYVIMNWANFIQIVDDLGGIDVTIPEYAYDPAYSTCQYCGDYYPIEFVPGTEHMDGTRALEYARIRKSDNDFKRIERQQLVLRAIIAKGKTLNLLNVGKLKDLYDTYSNSVQTDIPDTQVPGLALLVKQIDDTQGLGNLKMVSMAPATYSCEQNDDCPGNPPAAVLDWNPQKVALLKAQVFSDVQLSTDNAAVSVLNATNTPSLATDFSTQLKANGIPPANITVDEYANGLLYPTTVIVNVSGSNDHTISQIQGWLGIPDSHVLTAADPQAAQFLGTTANVVVVLGADAAEDSTGEISVTQQTGG